MKSKKELIWIGIFLVFLLAVGIVMSALIPIDNNRYVSDESSKLLFTETTKPENYLYSFPVGNKIYGIDLNSNSDLLYKDDDGNIQGVNDYALEWTIIYSSYAKIQEQQIQIQEMNTTINKLNATLQILCNQQPLQIC